MHYKNGRPARQGDPVVHQDSYSKNVNVGMLIDPSPNSTSCNGTLVRAAGSCLTITIGDAYHADDAYVSIDKQRQAANEAALPAANPLPGPHAAVEPPSGSCAAKVVLAILFAVLFAFGSKAQGAFSDETNFLGTVANYLSSNNTNFTWIGNKLEFEVGADFENNVLWANNIEVQYNVSDNFGIGDRIRNAGIAGTVVSEEAKVSYTLVNSYAIKVEADLYAGYDLQYECAEIEPQLDFRKKLTPNTFAGVYIGEPFLIQKNLGKNQWVPNVGLETGFTF